MKRFYNFKIHIININTKFLLKRIIVLMNSIQFRVYTEDSLCICFKPRGQEFIKRNIVQTMYSYRLYALIIKAATKIHWEVDKCRVRSTTKHKFNFNEMSEIDRRWGVEGENNQIGVKAWLWQLNVISVRTYFISPQRPS